MSDKEDEKVVIYTDGGCRPNPGVGGWAAILVYNGNEKEIFGGEPKTTNNRMELTAAVEALSALKRRTSAIIHTDSEYLQKGITQWIKNWKKKNWRRREGPVKNADLWQKLDSLMDQHEVEWRWVRGHSGDYYNERCDELATLAIERMKHGAE